MFIIIVTDKNYDQIIDGENSQRVQLESMIKRNEESAKGIKYSKISSPITQIAQVLIIFKPF